jgi:hypothetical protein
LYRRFQIKSVLQDIEIIEIEKTHLEAMKGSSVEMNRSAYKSLFIVLSLISLAELIPTFILVVSTSGISATHSVSLIVWSAVLGLSLKFTKRYHNLGNYEKSIKRMEEKLNKLNKRADNGTKI